MDLLFNGDAAPIVRRGGKLIRVLGPDLFLDGRALLAELWAAQEPLKAVECES